MNFRSIRPVALLLVFFAGLFSVTGNAQPATPESEPDAEAVIARAVAFLGGDAYLNVKTQVGRGRYSVMRDGVVVLFQSFHDVIVYPRTERTEFRAGKVVTVQTNVEDSGWVYDGNTGTIRDQTDVQIANFDRVIRVSLDTLLRGEWKGRAKIEYAGRRPATLGKRNDVLRLTYDDGLIVEFEIGSVDGVPAKAIQRRTNANGEETVEEDRYAQFVSIRNIKVPFIIDRFQKGVHLSRINYESVEHNVLFDESYFEKPLNERQLRRSLKL